MSKRLKEERRGQHQAGPSPSASRPPRPTARGNDGRLLWSMVKAEIESREALFPRKREQALAMVQKYVVLVAWRIIAINM